jgi:hypothetical protein
MFFFASDGQWVYSGPHVFLANVLETGTTQRLATCANE